MNRRARFAVSGCKVLRNGLFRIAGQAPGGSTMPKKKTADSSDGRRKELLQRIDAAWEDDDWEVLIRLYDELAALGDSDLSGDDHYRLGYAHDELGDYDKAIACYQDALEAPGLDGPGYAWNCMGISYARKQEYDKAIECYRKALDTPGYSAPAHAWNNMGNTYAGRQDHHKAVECYQKALDTPGYDTPEKAWYNMGLSLKEKGSHAHALEAFSKAATLYEEAGDAARGEMARAQAETVKLAQSSGSEAAEALYPALSAATAGAGEGDLYDPLQELQQLEGETQLVVESYHKRAGVDRELPESALVFLKGWSSSEPILVRAHEMRTDSRAAGFSSAGRTRAWQ